MHRLHRCHLEQLLGSGGFPAVSLYLPTHNQDAEEQNLELGRLLREAEEGLRERGLGPTDSRKLLLPALALLDELPFWACSSSQTQALFLGRSEHLFLSSPYPAEACAVVGQQSYVVPLLPILRDDVRFFWLSLESERLRLFKGDLYHVREVEPQELPSQLGRLLRCDPDHYGQVAQELQPLLSAAPPLLLSGPAELRQLYRQASGDPELLEMPDAQADDDLGKVAWGALRGWLDTPCRAALAEMDSPPLEEVIRAAEAGEIKALLLPQGLQFWGHWQGGRLVGGGIPGPGDEEQLNRAALAVLERSGQVWVCPREVLQAPSAVFQSASVCESIASIASAQKVGPV